MYMFFDPYTPLKAHMLDKFVSIQRRKRAVVETLLGGPQKVLVIKGG